MPANPDCRYCHGTGIVTDWVPYGSTNIPMDTECDCVYDGWVECPICVGEGNVIPDLDDGLDVTCLTCQGNGYISPEKYESTLSLMRED